MSNKAESRELTFDFWRTPLMTRNEIIEQQAKLMLIYYD